MLQLRWSTKMGRKSSIYFLIIPILFLIPGHLLSLGLGDIEVNSALNQPLNAQINLIAAREDEFEELRVELAPANVFDRVGVPRPYFLTQLKFQPIKLPNGGTAVQVTSKDPVREPFLTFLVEVTWPKGRLLREYTVLLDPPEFAQQQAPQVATPATAPVEPVVETDPVVTPQQSSQPEIVDTEEDINAIRERMDRALGIDGTEEIEPVVEEVAEVAEVAEEAEVIEEEVVADAEPTAEELEEAVAETVEEAEPVVEESPVVESVEDVAVADDVVEEEIAEVDERDLETIRKEMDEALGIDGTEPIERDIEVVAETTGTQELVTGEVLVEKGDTLYNIAKAAKPSSVTMNQMMLAIQEANSDAFINNNVNLLKQGAVLRIPQENEAQALSSSEARKLISEQNALWKEYRGVVTQTPATNVDAPELVEESSDLAKEAKQALKEATEKPAETKQDLNILASEDANQSPDTQIAGGEEVKKLQNEVNLNKELAASRAKENEELKSRVEALESMLEKKEKILNIQNQQLKELQEQLSTETDKAAAAEKLLKEKALKEETEPEVKSEAKPDPKPVVKEEIKEPVVEPLPEFTEPVVAEQAIGKPKLEPLPDWDSLPAIEETLSEEVAETPPEEKPAEATKPEEKPTEIKTAEAPTAPEAEAGFMGFALSFLESLKEKASNALLPLLGGVLLLLGGLWFWKKKQVKTVELTGLGEMPMEAIEDGEHFDDILDETIITPQVSAQASTSDEDLGGVAENLATEGENDFSAEASEESGDTEEGEDVLDEADVYISYGLHQQAQDLLNDAIANEPGRNDYKVKLAEVYYSQKDQEGFEQYAGKIKNELGESSNDWQKIMSMGKELAPASALFAGAAAAAGTAASAAFDKPDEADVDIGLQTAINEPLSDANLEDTMLDNDAEEDDGGLDFNVDDFVDEQIEDDPVASKIMEANETSDILNFDVDDISEDAMTEDSVDTELDAIATGLHESASMDDLTQELEEIGMQTTMNDLKPLEIDEDEDDASDEVSPQDTTIAMEQDEIGIDTGISEPDPEATAAYSSSSLSNEIDQVTEQFDAGDMDTEFLDPAEQTVAQTHTDLEELGPPSLIEEVGTKLDLAKAFVDMGDSDAAKETLLEVINEGDESQIKAAKDLMDKLGS